MPDAPPSSPSALAPDSPPTPRLRLSIAHLLLLTAAIAVALGLYLGLSPLRQASADLTHYLVNLLFANLNAIAFVGSMIFAYHALCAPRTIRPTPGHWLLVWCAIDAFAATASEIVASRTLSVHYFLLGLICGHGITAMVTAVIGYGCVRPPIWKTFFGLQAALACCTIAAATPPLFVISFPTVQIAINVLQFASIVAMVIYSLFKRQLFSDWLHALGMAVATARSAMLAISWLSLTAYW